MADVLTQSSTNYADLFARVTEFSGNEPAWLRARREKGFAEFSALGFPTTSDEDWRYTSLSPIADREFTLAPNRASVSTNELAEFAYDGLKGGWLTFVDGRFRPEYSKLQNVPAGVVALSLREATEKHPQLVEKHLGKQSDSKKNVFASMNDAFGRDGFFFFVPRNVVIEEPIHLIFITSREASGAIANVRNVWVLEENSAATIIETHGAVEDSVYLKNTVTEVTLGANANMDHYIIQRESMTASHVSSFYLYQDRSSLARSHTFDFGGALVRHNITGILDGQGCEAIVNGLYVLAGKQHVDNFMWMEHKQENIPSHELYKGVLDDESSAVFTGRIYVHPEAQKTDAKQTNQTLLLSDNARTTTRPQLEIYADDVKCTHGATIGQLDRTAQFYCESRGIDRDTARKLLVHAFASDVVERVKIDSLRRKIEEILTARLEK